MNKVRFVLTVLAIASILKAEAQHDLFSRIKQKYPDEPAVFIERSETMTISVDGDSLRVYSDIFEDILHLKDQTEAYASKRVYGSHFNQVENIKAKTLLWKKTAIKK